MQSTEICPSDTPTKRTAESQPVDSDYKKMSASLHAYMFGAINFLELLTTFERILNVTPTPESSEAEMMDGQ